MDVSKSHDKKKEKMAPILAHTLNSVQNEGAVSYAISFLNWENAKALNSLTPEKV